MTTQHTVVVLMESKPDKIEELKKVLMNVIQPSRAEKHCIEYRLHQDINNPALFIFYENWESEELHKQQFEKPYILEYIKQLEGLLAKPFQLHFAKEVMI